MLVELATVASLLAETHRDVASFTETTVTQVTQMVFNVKVCNSALCEMGRNELYIAATFRDINKQMLP